MSEFSVIERYFQKLGAERRATLRTRCNTGTSTASGMKGCSSKCFPPTGQDARAVTRRHFGLKVNLDFLTFTCTFGERAMAECLFGIVSLMCQCLFFWFLGLFPNNHSIPLAKKLKECGVFGVSSDEYLNYAQHNRAEWQARGKEVLAEMVQKYQTSAAL